MFKNHASVMLLIDPNDGKIIDANQSAVNFYGYTLDELKQMNMYKINQASIFELKEKYQQVKNSIINKFFSKGTINPPAPSIIRTSQNCCKYFFFSLI